MAKAVVLLSGGLDSATVLAIAIREGYQAHALSFRYGQRHVIELAAARRVAEKLGATEHQIVDVDLRAFGGSALTDDAIAVPHGELDTTAIPVTYVFKETPTPRQARGVLSTSVITIGKSRLAISSRRIFWSCGSSAAGNEAWAQKRASTREVDPTWRDSAPTIWVVNRNTAITSTLLALAHAGDHLIGPNPEAVPLDMGQVFQHLREHGPDSVGYGVGDLEKLLTRQVINQFIPALQNSIVNESIHPYAVYLLSGLLAWNLFSGSLSLGVRSVVDNANLVKKVYMPREVLPLASLGASMVDFGLQLLVLVVFMLALRHVVVGWNLLLLPLAFIVLLVLTAAFSLWVAALNVRYRDTQHLLNLALLAWFWFTPIVYSSGGLQARLQHHGDWLWLLYLSNPLAAVIFGFQRALFGNVGPCGPVPPSVGWEAMLLGCVLVGGLVLLYVFWRKFFSLSGDFAEEL